jgi:peptidoglycan/LPS O-acetylase OafA/YrhL
VRRKRLDSLDGLRALAVILVFAHHVDQSALPGGFVGVDVFFVISGYLITWLLLQEHDRLGGIDLARFYGRRALRLYPALIVLVILASIAAAVRGLGSPAADGAGAATYVTDIYANIATHPSLVLHTWSLSVEEQFYLLWPAVLILSLRRGWPVTKVIVSAIAASIAITLFFGVSPRPHVAFVQFLPTSHIAELGGGALLAVALRSAPPSALLKRLSGPAVAAGALALLLVAELTLAAHWWAFPAVALICWPPVAHLVIHRESSISRAFSSRSAVWLGERSYGFYLYHYPILMLLVLAGASVTVRIAIGLPLTLAVTAASWTYVERPFLTLKDRMMSARVQNA